MKHIEDNTQEACVTWFGLQYPLYEKLLFHVPNGGKRDKKEAVRLKKQGVKRGVSDLVLLVANREFNALCIEMKTMDGTQDKGQKEFEKAVKEAGNAYCIARNIHQFMNIINDYLNE